MRSYVALLRGIGPGNPNMRNDKLRGAFESLGFTNVRTVISSGNVLFDADASDTAALEVKIEKALPEQLGFTSTAIVRSREEWQQLVDRDPFKGMEHSDKSFQNVTFLKTEPHTSLTFPYRPEGKTYTLLSLQGREICSIIDLTGAKTPDLMTWLEKQFTKDITTRTYKTVGRIMKKLTESPQ